MGWFSAPPWTSRWYMYTFIKRLNIILYNRMLHMFPIFSLLYAPSYMYRAVHPLHSNRSAHSTSPGVSAHRWFPTWVPRKGGILSLLSRHSWIYLSRPYCPSSVSPGPTTKRPPSKAHTKKPSAPHASTKHPVVLHPPSKPAVPTPTKPVVKPHYPRTPLARDNVMVDMYLRISGNNIGSNIKVKEDVEINT